GLASGDGGDGATFGDFKELANHYNTWHGSWAVWGGFDYKFSERGTLYAQLSYTDGNKLGYTGQSYQDLFTGLAVPGYSADVWGAAVGVNYELVPGLLIRPEFAYASAKDKIAGSPT